MKPRTLQMVLVFSIRLICLKCQTKPQPWPPCCLPLAFPFLQRANRRNWRSGTLTSGVTSVVVLTCCLASSCVYQVCGQHTRTHRILINLIFRQQNIVTSSTQAPTCVPLFVLELVCVHLVCMTVQECCWADRARSPNGRSPV